MKMNDLKQKINGLKWLKEIGIEYFCSQKEIIPKLKDINPALNANKSLINSEEIKKSTHVQHNLINNIEDNTSLLSRQLADSVENLEELRKIVSEFEGCNLKKLALNTVFSDGNSSAPFMFIGEAPGGTEDKMGIPFCGESGKLLDNMLASIGISRQANAYITNTVFWRPPANRPPTQEEINICRPFVEKHIALINPKLIILVGSTAATSLLGKHAGITKIRQAFYTYSNKYLTTSIPLTAIFHPAYLLRQPLQKKTSWFDLIKIKQFADENFSQ